MERKYPQYFKYGEIQINERGLMAWPPTPALWRIGEEVPARSRISGEDGDPLHRFNPSL